MLSFLMVGIRTVTIELENANILMSASVVRPIANIPQLTLPVHVKQACKKLFPNLLLNDSSIILANYFLGIFSKCICKAISQSFKSYLAFCLLIIFEKVVRQKTLHKFKVGKI